MRDAPVFHDLLKILFCSVIFVICIVGGSKSLFHLYRYSNYEKGATLYQIPQTEGCKVLCLFSPPSIIIGSVHNVEHKGRYHQVDNVTLAIFVFYRPSSAKAVPLD